MISQHFFLCSRVFVARHLAWKVADVCALYRLINLIDFRPTHIAHKNLLYKMKSNENPKPTEKYFFSHTTRACDTLRVILLHFLPVIQANIDSYAPTRALGVDIPREERQNKCLQCRDWLLRIKSLPENRHIGSNLLALQNLIVDIWAKCAFYL